ncbi:c-type cytochrome [Duganella violaceipulchra]|uniref:Cytochrome c n=1 Tax=Duganella violaceipulchra TaxID=2849652 RepID=A0AA41L6N8_9BURK|nr:cytochrome c [Duganella violaceicalia]MBV6325464.1 cytochrome c [Duganella violaceicalia]MCP2012634.1 mono/diheme cytochrome c family protein [Duganella violaceicalia]
MRLKILIGALMGLATISMAVGIEAQAADLLSQQCVACHAVTKPEKVSLERLWDRKGPDLYYAGSKFNKPWLVSWLQNPTTIRGGGVMYAKTVKAGADRSVDTIDPAQVPAHPKLSAADAATAADLLMVLKGDGLVTAGAFKNEPPSSMASMLFSKLRGCTSCHTAKASGAPTSGPELYTGGDRLQPDFVHAYINNPQKFDAHTWMPTLGLTDADIQKLTGYIGTLKSEKK